MWLRMELRFRLSISSAAAKYRAIILAAPCPLMKLWRYFLIRSKAPWPDGRNNRPAYSTVIQGLSLDRSACPERTRSTGLLGQTVQIGRAPCRDECVSTLSSRGSLYQLKKKIN